MDHQNAQKDQASRDFQRTQGSDSNANYAINRGGALGAVGREDSYVRHMALQMANTSGETAKDVVARAEAYLKFLQS